MYFKMNNATSGESTEAWNLKEIRELQKENPEKITNIYLSHKFLFVWGIW